MAKGPDVEDLRASSRKRRRENGHGAISVEGVAPPAPAGCIWVLYFSDQVNVLRELVKDEIYRSKPRGARPISKCGCCWRLTSISEKTAKATCPT
jgi:hypothetical protein